VVEASTARVDSCSTSGRARRSAPWQLLHLLHRQPVSLFRHNIRSLLLNAHILVVSVLCCAGFAPASSLIDYVKQLFLLVRNQVTPEVYQKITEHVKRVKDSSLPNTEKRKQIMDGLIK
jgi:hypothetical protein